MAPGARRFGLDVVTTDVLLRFLGFCRAARVAGRVGNVITLDGRRLDQYAATTINRRLAAISGLFGFRALRDPDLRSPVPRGVRARNLATFTRPAHIRGSSRRAGLV